MIDNYSQLSPDQQKEFADLLRKLVKRIANVELPNPNRGKEVTVLQNVLGAFLRAGYQLGTENNQELMSCLHALRLMNLDLAEKLDVLNDSVPAGELAGPTLFVLAKVGDQLELRTKDDLRIIGITRRQDSALSIDSIFIEDGVRKRKTIKVPAGKAYIFGNESVGRNIRRFKLTNVEGQVILESMEVRPDRKIDFIYCTKAASRNAEQMLPAVDGWQDFEVDALADVVAKSCLFGREGDIDFCDSLATKTLQTAFGSVAFHCSTAAKKLMDPTRVGDDRVYYQERDDELLLGVADGVGGAPFGNVVANIVALASFIYLHVHSLQDFAVRMIKSHPSLKLESSAVFANARVGKSDKPGLYNLHISWLGDSRVLVLKPGTENDLEVEVTPMHSPVGYAIVAGDLTEEDGLIADNAHVISYSVNAFKPHTPEEMALTDLPKGTVVLLGTDGLFGNFSPNQLKLIIMRIPQRERTAERIMQELIKELAKFRSGEPASDGVERVESHFVDDDKGVVAMVLGGPVLDDA